MTEFLGEELKKQGLDKLYGALEQDPELAEKLEEFCDKEIFDGV